MFAVDYWAVDYWAVDYWAKFTGVDIPEGRTIIIPDEDRSIIIVSEDRSVMIMAATDCTNPQNFDVPLHPEGDVPYLYKFYPWLDGENDTINSFVITLPDEAIADGLETHDEELVDVTDDEGNVHINGGVVVWLNVADGNQDDLGFDNPGKVYKIKCEITTNSTPARVKPVEPSLTVRRL